MTVADNAALDPGSRQWAVTLRLRTTQPSSNVVQKGQANTSGGYYKMEIHHGVIGCLFRDGAHVSAGMSSSTRVDDGAWHTVRCEHRDGRVSIRVDSGSTRTNYKDIGSVSNGWPLVMGGKYTCNPPDVTCDYFNGDLDYVRIEAL